MKPLKIEFEAFGPYVGHEEVDFEILEKNLAHLLGIDYKYLLNYEFEDYRKNVLGIDLVLDI